MHSGTRELGLSAQAQNALEVSPVPPSNPSAFNWQGDLAVNVGYCQGSPVSHSTMAAQRHAGSGDPASERLTASLIHVSVGMYDMRSGAVLVGR